MYEDPRQQSLEHYGVKGMKWGRTKTSTDEMWERGSITRPTSSLYGTSFWDAKVYQIPAWIAANSERMNTGDHTDRIDIRKRLNDAKKRIQSIGKKPVSKMNTKTVKIGQSAMKKALSSVTGTIGLAQRKVNARAASKSKKSK